MLQVALIGLGPWGRRLARAFSRARRCRLVAVCDTDEARLNSPLSDLGGPLASRRVASPSAILRDPAVDAVVLATPPRTHAALGAAVLDAGKHLFVEKPMAMSQLEAGAMLRAARRRSRRGMVGHLLLYHPAVTEMIRAAASGELGDIQTVVTHRASPPRADRAEGAWWTLGPHDVSLACHLLAGQPLGVSARFYRRGELPEHRAQARFDFPAGRTAVLCTRFRNGRARRVALVGSRRTLVFDDNWPSCRLRLYETPGGACSSIARVDALARGPIVRMPPLPDGEPLAIEVQHFVDGLLDGAPFRSDLDEGLSVVAWLEAAEKASVASGAPERVFGSAPASPALPLVV